MAVCPARALALVGVKLHVAHAPAAPPCPALPLAPRNALPLAPRNLSRYIMRRVCAHKRARCKIGSTGQGAFTLSPISRRSRKITVSRLAPPSGFELLRVKKYWMEISKTVMDSYSLPRWMACVNMR